MARPVPVSVRRFGNRLPTALKPGRNACLLKVQQVLGEWQFIFQAFSPQRTALAVQVIDKAQQKVPRAAIELYADGKVIARTECDANGKGSLFIDSIDG